ncbi:Tigger transposable element-derived protein 6, partial [Araneus ventricosus]
MKWFRSARAKNIPVSGVLLQEKARELGESLGLETFKASNVWMEIFRTRHNISFKQICGEEKSVNPKEVTDWIGKLKSLLKGYDDRDISNADETGLFYPGVLPGKTLCFKGENVVAGKFQKSGSLFCCVATCWETSKLQLLLEKPRSLDVSRTLMYENLAFRRSQIRK